MTMMMIRRWVHQLERSVWPLFGEVVGGESCSGRKEVAVAFVARLVVVVAAKRQQQRQSPPRVAAAREGWRTREGSDRMSDPAVELEQVEELLM